MTPCPRAGRSRRLLGLRGAAPDELEAEAALRAQVTVASVTVESEVGKGSSFKIHLPAQPGAKDERPASIPATVPRGNGESILVVDDEANVRDVITRTLERHGYRVLVATDGGDACAKFALHLAEIKLVLTDLDMPLMGGVAMMRVIRKMNPQIKIIISSGKISDPPDLSQGTMLRDLQVSAILAKPYTAEAVLRLVHDLLHGADRQNETGADPR